MYRLMVCLLQVLKNKISLYARSRLFYYFRSSFIHLSIFFQVSFVVNRQYSFIKSQNFCINTFHSCTAQEQKEKNLIKDLISKKVTYCSAKILLVALIAFSNFLSESWAINFLVSISIPNTIIYIFVIYFELFLGMLNKLVIQLCYIAGFNYFNSDNIYKIHKDPS